MSNNLYSIETEKSDFVLIGKSSQSGTNKRLCFHSVENGKVGAEVPFLKETAQRIFSIFNELEYTPKHFEGLIPNDILFAQDSKSKGLKMGWIVKSCTKQLDFNKEYKHLSGAYRIPTLFFYFHRSLKVYAITDQDSKNITGETQLYQAPFFNVSNAGNVCMGNVNLKLTDKFLTFEKCRNYLENSFWNSQFTHSNFGELITEEYLVKNQNNSAWTKKELAASPSLTINKILSL
jgi:PRTRC genetic system protein B